MAISVGLAAVFPNDTRATLLFVGASVVIGVSFVVLPVIDDVSSLGLESCVNHTNGVSGYMPDRNCRPSEAARRPHRPCWYPHHARPHVRIPRCSAHPVIRVRLPRRASGTLWHGINNRTARHSRYIWYLPGVTVDFCCPRICNLTLKLFYYLFL